jgi:hypothetical protein
MRFGRTLAIYRRPIGERLDTVGGRWEDRVMSYLVCLDRISPRPPG